MYGQFLKKSGLQAEHYKSTICHKANKSHDTFIYSDVGVTSSESQYQLHAQVDTACGQSSEQQSNFCPQCCRHLGRGRREKCQSGFSHAASAQVLYPRQLANQGRCFKPRDLRDARAVMRHRPRSPVVPHEACLLPTPDDS